MDVAHVVHVCFSCAWKMKLHSALSVNHTAQPVELDALYALYVAVCAI